MNCLDIVGMVISPSPSHAFGLNVCDLKHKVAVWQGYALNRACDLQQALYSIL
jgi:hypothetical protein